MTDIYPRLDYEYRMPSTIPNLWDGGWKNETATKVYLELVAFGFGIVMVENLDARDEAKIKRSDYKVRYGDPQEPHILEVKPDLRRFLHSIGEDGSPLFDGIRQDEEAYEPHNLSWPSIVFAGTDVDGHRKRLEREYPGEVIVADEDAPDGCPTYSAFQRSLARSFEYFQSE